MSLVTDRRSQKLLWKRGQLEAGTQGATSIWLKAGSSGRMTFVPEA